MAAKSMTEEMAVLAATRAALDPERGAWQHDILVSTIIEVLSRQGSLTQRELKDHLKRTWVAQGTSDTLLTHALETAHDQDLLEMVEGPKGRRRWSLAPPVQVEARGDHAWAQSLLEDLKAGVRTHLEERCAGIPGVVDRVPSLTKALIEAMIRASRDIFQAVQQSSSPTDLTEVRFNLRSVVPELRRSIKPVELADAMSELALMAADPDQSFGNEVLTTIVAGQVLHGMVCRADVEMPPPKTALVLDTSQLLLLASHDDKVVSLFRDFLKTAQSHGCELMITDRVLSEWEGHWAGACEQEQRIRARYGDGTVEVLKMHDLGALTFYAYWVGGERRSSFVEWAGQRRNLRKVMAEFDIKFVETAPDAPPAPFVTAFAEAIEGVQTESGRPVRPLRLRETDGYSAELVHDRRQEDPGSLVPSAWFVANDRTSMQAYRSISDDQFPLVISAATWLLYYSAFDPGDAGEARRQLADRVSEEVILEAFLSVAGSYTTDDMLELGDLIDRGDTFDADDVRETVLRNFLDPQEHSKDRVKDLARKRIQRQSARVVRSRELDAERERKHRQELDDRDTRIRQLEKSVNSRGLGQRSATRTAEAVAVGAAGVIGLVLMSAMDWVPTEVDLVAWVAFTVLYTAEAYRYVKSDVGRLAFFCQVVTVYGAAALFLVLDNGFGLGKVTH